jgi:hypothetical protein
MEFSFLSTLMKRLITMNFIFQIEQNCGRKNVYWRHMGICRWEVHIKEKEPIMIRRTSWTYYNSPQQIHPILINSNKYALWKKNISRY